MNFPSCTSIGSYAFNACSQLTTISFPACTIIGLYAFSNCTSLSSAYFLGSSIPTLSHINAFNKTPISTAINGITGSIYVPASLYSNYRTANNWSAYADRFVSLTAEEIAALNT